VIYLNIEVKLVLRTWCYLMLVQIVNLYKYFEFSDPVKQQLLNNHTRIKIFQCMHTVLAYNADQLPLITLCSICCITSLTW